MRDDPDLTALRAAADQDFAHLNARLDAQVNMVRWMLADQRSDSTATAALLVNQIMKGLQEPGTLQPTINVLVVALIRFAEQSPDD